MKTKLLTSAAIIAGLAFGQSAFADSANQMFERRESALPVQAERALTVQRGELQAQWGDLDTFWGDLDTFWGDLDTFEGQNGASWGDLDTFWGDLDTFWGDLDTFEGMNSAFWGDLDTFWGDLDTFSGTGSYARWGDLDTFWGDLDTFEGGTSAQWGDLDTFWGDLDTFWGDLDTFWGDLDTFWGDLDTFENNIDAQWGDLDTFMGSLFILWGDLDTFWGDLDTFQGPLDASYGDLDTFWGDLDTFNGNLDSSWGDLDTFWGNFQVFWGDLDTFWGDLDTFWGDLDTFWGDLDTFWGDLDTFGPTTEAEYEQVLSDLGTFYNLSQEKFGVPVAMLTGQDFWQGFAKDVFDKYGIDPSDPSSLADLDSVDRAKFFVDWYDGLMQFSGVDRVDHWMNDVSWSPALTQDHDYNTEAVIGLLDFGITDETLLSQDIIYTGGYETEAGDFHGSAVISLMIAPHDGKGLMGIAPNASVAAYNPFDETKSAGFEDVETGIYELIDNGARIINMSLGVPENVLTEDWSSILSDVVNDPSSEGTIFVKAAGNDGVVQLNNINWDDEAALERLILVGATGLDGEIASWSNTPGEACAVIGGVCDDANKLKNYFLVAPGEFMLVADGEGGVTRVSGTSFAAPLVSGTAALIHGAWPWWKQHGEETVDVILQSATDLGEEGVDDVYGWGMLNVEGALSPLSWDNLRFYHARTEDGRLSNGKSSRWIQNAYMRSNVLSMENRGAYIVAIERVGGTYRDFRIPLSTQLYGATNDADGLARERRFQRHLHQRFVDWATGGSSFGDTQGFSAPLGLNGDWTMSMTARQYAPGTDIRDGDLPFQTDVVLAEPATGTELRMGYGDGASRLVSSNVFGFYSDFDIESGGVNPLLGLASGGSYASARMPLRENLSLSASISETSYDHTYLDPLTQLRIDDGRDMADYSAQAASVSLNYQANEKLRFNLDYTQLQEADSLLGDQGTGLLAMEGGSVTDAVTFGTEFDLPARFTLAGSATLGKTRATRFDGDFLAISEEGLQSSAFAIGLHKSGLFSKSDQIRFSIAQPLQLENGALEFTALEVVDRETGELGQVTQVWAVDQSDRNLMLEAIYAVPMFDGMGDFTAFTRSGSTIADQRFTDENEFSFGAQIRIRY
ncbi:S8 family peptidase [Ponticaulis profundi]|uniref:S8 family serine peptidase n=1 Tax=Ponticaulis profundi TaxID=2665222 RepID=A0ABW1SBK4_9PROT